ncbi:hemin uptake protein HemP [Cypionkella aquatica]|nr:hemin uptake protein HemP [Cypionkella aquatica]
MAPAPEPVASDRTLRYDARALTGGAGTAYIELDGQIYTLRITKSAKLILTK